MPTTRHARHHLRRAATVVAALALAAGAGAQAGAATAAAPGGSTSVAGTGGLAATTADPVGDPAADAEAAVSEAGRLALAVGAGEQPTSTPVPIATPEGQVSSYVVNARTVGTVPMQQVLRSVRRAGGTVVKAWPQIGVVVAHSTHASFRDDVVRIGGTSVRSVGATRTVAVSERTPAPVRGIGSADSSRAGGLSTLAPGAAAPAAPEADPLEADQWDMRVIGADDAHEVTDGRRQVVVGVLDSGIDADHPDLAPNLDVADSVNCTDAGAPDRSATGWQPTTSDHGTHVAGTVAAARNGVGIVGVAPAVRVASVKVVNDDGFIYPEYAVCGFMWAGLRGMDVTNNSYYVDPFQFYCDDQPDQLAAKEAVRRAVSWSTRQGVVHAAAAGNSVYDLSAKTTDSSSPDDSAPVERVINDDCQDIPAELDGVVTVASLAQVGTGSDPLADTTLSSFSNRGLGKIDVAAPGSRILSTVVTNNGYGLKSGTSMASPHVAGVLALMRSAHPTWAPARLVRELKADAVAKECTTTTAGAPCVGTVDDNSFYGAGVVDALAAVR
jgi:subtilisin family serine protease